MRSGRDLLRESKILGAWLLLTLVFCMWPPLVQGQDHPTHEGHDANGGQAGMSNDMPGMDMNSTAPDPMAAMRTPEKLAADKRESEFNHHLAGFFVVLAGIFILSGPRFSTRWPTVRYAWPVCFLDRKSV